MDVGWIRIVLCVAAVTAIGCGSDDVGGAPDAVDAASADVAAPVDAQPADDAVAPDTAVGVDAADTTGADADPGVRGSWTTLAPVLGGPVQENAVVAIGADIYVLGGFRNGFQIVADVSVYDTTANTWSAGPPLPAAHHHVIAAAANDRLVVLGALTGLGFSAARVAWRLDDGAWTAITPLEAGRERGAAATAVIGDVVYVIGGFRGGAAVALVDSFDVTEGRWELVAPLPAPRDHVVAAAHGGVVYALGGRDTAVDAIRGEVWALDPAVGMWEPRAPLPTSRGGAMAGVVAGRIVVVGGEGNPDHPRGVFDTVEAYDPATDTWEVLAPMPTARHGTGAVGIGDTLFVPGGADKEFFQAVDVFEALTL